MNNEERLKQILGAGVTVYIGNHYFPLDEPLKDGLFPLQYASRSRLLGLFTDRAKEFAVGPVHDLAITQRAGSIYETMSNILSENPGLDGLPAGKKQRIDVDVHIISLHTGEMYQFLLPSIVTYKIPPERKRN